MKNLVKYITEKFKINSKNISKNKDIDVYYDKSNYQEAIENLQEIAKDYGYKIKFRNRKMDTGDFCIFIYDANKPGSSYLTGFDGDWDAKENTQYDNTFNKCYLQSIKWMEDNK